MAARPCKFGYTCKRADCWFAHPEGRQIDGAKAQPQQSAAPAYAIAANAQNFKAPEGYGAAVPQYYAAQQHHGAGGYGGYPQQQHHQQPQHYQQPMHGMAPHNPQAGGGAGSGAGAYRSVTRPLTPSSATATGTGGAATAASVAALSNGTAMLSDGKRPCKFGRECHRKDCYFSHPDGRDIDDSPHSSSASTPKFRGARGGKGKSYAASSSASGRDSVNPDDYDIEGLDDDELDDNAVNALVTAKEWFPAYKDCSCCKGYIHDCEDTTCQALGTCGCAYGKDEAESGAAGGVSAAGGGADDSWKDEFFGASRSCKCCEGFVYRCKGTDAACTATGKCFCQSASASAAAAAPAKLVAAAGAAPAMATATKPQAVAAAGKGPSAPGGPAV